MRLILGQEEEVCSAVDQDMEDTGFVMGRGSWQAWWSRRWKDGLESGRGVCE